MGAQRIAEKRPSPLSKFGAQHQQVIFNSISYSSHLIFRLQLTRFHDDVVIATCLNGHASAISLLITQHKPVNTVYCKPLNFRAPFIFAGK